MCKVSHVSIENYLDDLAGDETRDKAWKSYHELEEILEYCGLEEALEKSCPPSTQIICIGVLFDTESLTQSTEK